MMAAQESGTFFVIVTFDESYVMSEAQGSVTASCGVSMGLSKHL
jgi:hypothetical protein